MLPEYFLGCNLFKSKSLQPSLVVFPTTLISSFKISLVCFTFGYIQYFTTSYHTQLSIWVHAMLFSSWTILVAAWSPCFSSLSFSSHSPTYSQSDAVQASVRSHHATMHWLSMIVRQQQSWWTLMAPMICDAPELVFRRWFIPVQPTSLTAFHRLFSGLYPGLEHTSIAGGPYIVPELVSNCIEKLPQCSALISMRLLQTTECFFSYT